MKYFFLVFYIMMLSGGVYGMSLQEEIETNFLSIEQVIKSRVENIPAVKVRANHEKRLWKLQELKQTKLIRMSQGDKKLIAQAVWKKIKERDLNLTESTEDLIQELELINSINVLRKEKSVHQLTYDSQLTQAADRHARDLVNNFPMDADKNGTIDIISHVGSDGTRVAQRAFDSGYWALFLGENIAYNQITSNQVLYDWINSPSHYDNLVTPKANTIGLIKKGPYWVMVVGKRME